MRELDVESAKAALDRIYSRAVRGDFVSNGVSWNCLEYRKQPRSVYPYVSIGGCSYGMSRVVLTASLGRRLTKFCLHRCDNTKCIDAEHLYEGDHLMNMRDRSERCKFFGRAAIDPVLVKRIVGSVMSSRKLANLLGVGFATVCRHCRLAKRGASL